MPDVPNLPDPNFWIDLWELAKNAGPFGTCLMIIMWFLERQERLKIRALLDALFERTLAGLNSGVTATEKFNDTLEKLGDVIGRRRT